MRRLLAAIAISATALTACGGGDTAIGPRTNSGGPITTTAAPPLDGTNFVLDQHFWHDGFRVDLEAAEVWTSETRFTNRTSYWLTLRGQFRNLGDKAAFFEPDMSLVFDGMLLSTRQGQAPQVGAESSGPGELTFLVTDDFDYLQSELLVGAPDENQAKVPLGPEGDAVRLEPMEPRVSGAAVMDLLEISLASAVLRYDDPSSHTTVVEDMLALTLNLEILSRKDGNWRLVAEDFELVLPDGSAITPDGADLGSLAGSEEGVMTEGRFVRFIIDADSAGEYQLRITPGEWFLVEDGPTDMEIEFSL